MMNGSNLYPPNVHVLSDGVIGAVVGRSTPRISVSTTDSLPKALERRSIERGEDDQVSTDRRQQVSDKKRGRDERRHSKREAGVNKRDAASWIVYQRERHRINQSRYRQKQNVVMTSLKEANLKLQAEIARLEQCRNTPTRATPREECAWSVAIEYFRLFRHGVPDLPSSTSASCVQLDFMQATMTPDLEVNGGRGIELMLDSWRGRARWFDNVDVELMTLVRGPGDSLVASTRASVTITEHTLRYVFPHLRSADRDIDGKKASIAGRILGQRIVLGGSAHFDWDSRSGCMTSVLAQSDMLTPMLQLLGSLEDVSILFDKSLILPDSKWKATPKK